MKAILFLAMLLPLFPSPAGAAEASEGRGASVAGCDSSKNRETWYWSRRECGPAPTQLSWIANVSRENVQGSQVSFFSNIAMQDVDNAQVGFLFNYADSVRGSQWAWNFNLARKVDGFQVGGTNIADTVDGSQIGFLNISRHLGGYGIGFFTFARNSMLHGDAYVDETGMTKIGFTTGKGFFTTHYLGYAVAEDKHPYSFGLGFGYHAPFRWSYLEGELGAAAIMDESTDYSDIDDDFDEDFYDGEFRYNTLLQAKLRVGGKLTRLLSVFGGVTYNSLITHGEDRLIAPWTDDLTGTIDDTYFWPGFEVGIRLGR